MEPLYALKKYLEDIAFAGIHGEVIQDQQYLSILSDLRRFGASSPVIDRIIQSVEMLCNGSSDNTTDKRLLLLKSLELVNAVIYTQGFVGAEGELIPLIKGTGESIDIPYCYFSTVISAMKSGNRCYREKDLSDCYLNSPEMFTDYRLRRSIAEAIGDLYKPVYNIIQCIIVDSIGAEIIPLLSEYFDNTHSDMVRKRIIETIGKIQEKEANDWLKRQLSRQKFNAYRAEIITELSNFDENQDYLINLLKTEKRNALRAVIKGLKIERPESLRVLKDMFNLKTRSEDLNNLILSRISEHYKDKENDWYLKILNATIGQKLKNALLKTRQAVIRNLRYSDNNVELLTDLAMKHQEPCHDEILSILLYFDSDNALNIWNHELKNSNDGFKKLYKMMNDIDEEYTKNTGSRIRPLLPRLADTIKKYGTKSSDPYPIHIMLDMPVNLKKKQTAGQKSVKLEDKSNSSKESADKTDNMYQKLQNFAGGSVFGALKSIFNNKSTLKFANSVLNKVNSQDIESERGQVILSVAQKFISDQNDSYEREVVNRYKFEVDPDDPRMWCLSQLDDAKGERLMVILQYIIVNRSMQCCTDALVHSIYYMKPGTERRHILLSVLLYMQTKKAKDFWYEEIESCRESRMRLNVILRNVSNGRFYLSYFNENSTIDVPMADELLSDGRFDFI